MNEAPKDFNILNIGEKYEYFSSSDAVYEKFKLSTICLWITITSHSAQ